MSRSKSVGTTVGLVVLGTLAFAGGKFAVDSKRQADLSDAIAAVRLRAEPPSVDHRPFTLLVFFSVDDCAACLYETVVLDALAEELRGKLSVVGVVYGLPAHEVSRFREASGISYPLSVDAEEVERLFGFERPTSTNRPMTMVFDGRGGLIEVEQSGFSIAEHEEHADRLRELVLRGESR